MTHSSREDYLKAEVLTASPQKLQLMLIQAAARQVRQAMSAYDREDQSAAAEALLKAQDIIGEILGGLKRDVAPELTGKVAAVYVFVLRSLVVATLQHDRELLPDVLRILEEEQTTWRQVCDELGERSVPALPAAPPHLQERFANASSRSFPAGSLTPGPVSPAHMTSGPLNLEA